LYVEKGPYLWEQNPQHRHSMIAAQTGLVSKTAVLDALRQMPDMIPLDVLFDEIIYLYKVELALKQSQQGQGITIEAFREKVKTWAPPK
jgi:hypothetical protein